MKAHSDSITVVITGTIKPDKLDVAHTALQTVIPLVIANEPACHGVRVHEDPTDRHRLLIVEVWDSIEAFTGPHMQTPHQQAFFEQAQEFLAGPPDFAFWRETFSAP
jgi:quinol monooxygenase YgiN